jgi:hypothetical protein
MESMLKMVKISHYSRCLINIQSKFLNFCESSKCRDLDRTSSLALQAHSRMLIWVFIGAPNPNPAWVWVGFGFMTFDPNPSWVWVWVQIFDPKLGFGDV